MLNENALSDKPTLRELPPHKVSTTETCSSANAGRVLCFISSRGATLRSTATAAQREPRAHHYVPQFWLAGFTDTGEKDGRLWVTDLKRLKQWPSNPENTGHRRDFYRLSDSDAKDPVAFEKLFSRIEDTFAPMVRALDKRPRGPYLAEWESLFMYIAVQWMRVPAFRPMLLRIADDIQRRLMVKALKNPQSWATWLKKCGVAPDAPGADYDSMVKFEREHNYALSAEPEWYLYRGFKAIEHVAETLAERNWRACVSVKGGFIGSDNPTVMDGPKGELVGFKNAEIVLFPLSRHVLLVGTARRVKPMQATYMRVAAVNTFTMMTADEQVYSCAPDFYWLDENGNTQTDWRLFSKEKILQSGVGIQIAAYAE